MIAASKIQDLQDPTRPIANLNCLQEKLSKPFAVSLSCTVPCHRPAGPKFGWLTPDSVAGDDTSTGDSDDGTAGTISCDAYAHSTPCAH